jgi:hypothetical protein
VISLCLTRHLRAFGFDYYHGRVSVIILSNLESLLTSASYSVVFLYFLLPASLIGLAQEPYVEFSCLFFSNLFFITIRLRVPYT